MAPPEQQRRGARVPPRERRLLDGRRGLGLGLASALLLALPPEDVPRIAASAEPRNVLVIVGDDMGVETLAAYGVGPSPAHTPTLDALAADGLVFTRAWAHPVCSPTRAAALTGRYGFRTGVTSVGPGNDLAAAETTIPELFEAHPELDVAHAAVGKWHLGGGARGPNEQGFGHFAGVIGGVLTDYYAWPRVEDGVETQVTRYATSAQVDDASAWIAAQAADRPGRPWFLWLAFNAPHEPYHRPPDELHTVDLPPGAVPSRGPGTQPFYRAAIEAMDAEIGRLLAGMDPEVLARTTILFLGDNGTPVGAIGTPYDRDHAKGSLYQGGVHVPLLVGGAGIGSPGRRVDALVSDVDLFATVLDLLGLPPGAQPAGGDGRSFRALLESADAPEPRDRAFSEQTGSTRTPEKDGWTMREERFKYLRFATGVEELYDLLDDPFETRELLAAGPDGEASAALARLRARMDALLEGRPVGDGRLYFPLAQRALP